MEGCDRIHAAASLLSIRLGSVMSVLRNRVTQSVISEEERSRRVARVYELILSWPDPVEKETESTGNFGEDTANSARNTPAQEADDE